MFVYIALVVGSTAVHRSLPSVSRFSAHFCCAVSAIRPPLLLHESEFSQSFVNKM